MGPSFTLKVIPLKILSGESHIQKLKVRGYIGSRMMQGIWSSLAVQHPTPYLSKSNNHQRVSVVSQDWAWFGQGSAGKFFWYNIHQQGSVGSVQLVSSVVLESKMASLIPGLLAGTALSLSIRSLLQGSWTCQLSTSRVSVRERGYQSYQSLQAWAWKPNNCHFQVRAGAEPTQIGVGGQTLSVGGMCQEFHSYF